MKKLSSNSTFFYKKIFPVIWYAAIIFFLFTALFAGQRNAEADIMMVVVPVLMAVIGYFVMKNLIFDLMDEVYDEGATLLCKNKGKTVRINLRDIKNVSYTAVVNPPRVTISLRTKTDFGDELSFSPPASLVPFKRNSDIMELIDRIDRMRR